VVDLDAFCETFDVVESIDEVVRFNGKDDVRCICVGVFSNVISSDAGRTFISW